MYDEAGAPENVQAGALDALIAIDPDAAVLQAARLITVGHAALAAAEHLSKTRQSLVVYLAALAIGWEGMHLRLFGPPISAVAAAACLRHLPPLTASDALDLVQRFHGGALASLAPKGEVLRAVLGLLLSYPDEAEFVEEARFLLRHANLSDDDFSYAVSQIATRGGPAYVAMLSQLNSAPLAKESSILGPAPDSPLRDPSVIANALAARVVPPPVATKTLSRAAMATVHSVRVLAPDSEGKVTSEQVHAAAADLSDAPHRYVLYLRARLGDSDAHALAACLPHLQWVPTREAVELATNTLPTWPAIDALLTFIFGRADADDFVKVFSDWLVQFPYDDVSFEQLVHRGATSRRAAFLAALRQRQAQASPEQRAIISRELAAVSADPA